MIARPGDVVTGVRYKDDPFPDGPVRVLELRAVGGGRLEAVYDGEVMAEFQFEPGEKVRISTFAEAQGWRGEFIAWEGLLP